MDSDLSIAVLGLLSLRPLSGYSVRKIFLTTAWKSFSSSPGAIYPALNRLEAAGLIKGSVEKGETLRPRKIYALTKKGESTLKQYLAKPVTREDIIWRLNSIPLRFAFMGTHLEKERVLDFLTGLTTELNAYVDSLVAENKSLENEMPFCSQAAFRLGLENLRTHVRWAQKTYNELKNKKEI